MSNEDVRKLYVWLAVCILILLGSVVGIFFGLTFIIVAYNMGFIALLIPSGLIFLGSSVGVIVTGFRLKKINDHKNRHDAIFWLVIAILSTILIVVTYFLGRYAVLIIVGYLFVFIFVALSLISIFFVIINRDQLKRNR